jgi:WHG domain-containing protein
MAGVITTVAARLAIKKDIIEVVGPGRALADPPELRRSVPLGLRLLNRASMLPQSQLSMMAGGTSSPLMEDVPVFRDASETVMSRKPHTGRARRNCTLDELLTHLESGPTERIALELASEIEKRFGSAATLSEARTFCAKMSSKALCRRIEHATSGKSGADALRAMLHAMRHYALEHPGLSAACFRNLMKDSSKWPADEELARTLSSILAQLNVTGEQTQRALTAFRILVSGFAQEEMASPVSQSLECEKAYELAIDALIRGLLPPASNQGALFVD